MADYTLRVGEPLTIDLRDHLPGDATVQFYEVQPVEMAVCLYADKRMTVHCVQPGKGTLVVEYKNGHGQQGMLSFALEGIPASETERDEDVPLGGGIFANEASAHEAMASGETVEEAEEETLPDASGNLLPGKPAAKDAAGDEKEESRDGLSEKQKDAEGMFLQETFVPERDGLNGKYEEKNDPGKRKQTSGNEGENGNAPGNPLAELAKRLDLQSFFAPLRDPVAGNDPGRKSSGSLPPFASLLDELRQGELMAEEWMEDEEMEE